MDSGFQAFEVPYERRECYASEGVEAQQNVETYREGDTETLSAFLSSF